MGMKRLSLILGITAFALFFSSCEKDIPGKMEEGEKVEIFFSINTSNYHTAPDVVRSSDMKEPDSRTIYLNEDFYLRTTLEPDAEELRGDEPFIEGQRICFKAFDVSIPAAPVETDSKIYSYSTSAGKFIPLTTPLGVEPDGSTPYRFVAYSYFGEANVTPDDAVIDPVHDLVWGKTLTDQAITDTETSRTVTIHMTHQFARVKVVVKSGISGANITALSGVEVAGGMQATLTPFDGDISWSGTASQVVDPFTVNSVTDRESGYRTVAPVGTGPIGVRIGSIEVSASISIFSDKWAYFNSMLDAATSYTLVVELMRGAAFAYSNIFWDGEKLTFDVTDLGHQKYEGVFFKFGSLVGISPVAGFSSSTTILYKPAEIITGAYSTYGEIPYWDTNNDVGNPSISTLKGDICKYINPVYRLPRLGEFPVTGWSFLWVHGYPRLSDGTTVVPGYGTCGVFIFPTAEWLQPDGSFPSFSQSQHSRCYVWHSSAYDATKGYCFYFNNNDGSVVLTAPNDRNYAYPIRCIRN
jgi:hypothetical protein